MDSKQQQYREWIKKIRLCKRRKNCFATDEREHCKWAWEWVCEFDDALNLSVIFLWTCHRTCHTLSTRTYVLICFYFHEKCIILPFLLCTLRTNFVECELMKFWNSLDWQVNVCSKVKDIVSLKILKSRCVETIRLLFFGINVKTNTMPQMCTQETRYNGKWHVIKVKDIGCEWIAVSR